jgi:hypothetical protein
MRTTRADLDGLAAMIDKALDLPPGTHSVDYAYGRPRLTRNGGSVDVSPRLSTGPLADWMRAYFAGITARIMTADHVCTPACDRYDTPPWWSSDNADHPAFRRKDWA